MVGRCADYALTDYPNVVNFFLYADVEFRAKRISQSDNMTFEKAKDYVIKKDKQRSAYYNYYTTKKWGAATGYDYCINTEKLGIEGTKDLMRFIIERA